MIKNEDKNNNSVVETKEKVISIENMTFYYKVYGDDGEAVNSVGVTDINLDIFEGEFVALVGHNGSGKSTLAKLLNALLIPREGRVLVFNNDTADKSKLFDIRKSVGMVFQNPDNQMVASIVNEDVAFGPENLGIKQEEIVERVNWALECVGMSEYANRSPHKLSGGQKQRIAIAGALAIKPKVLVLDESTAMLDPIGRKEVLKVAHKLNKEQKMTIVLITHFMEEVLDCDRVIVLNEGKIHAVGTPKEIFNQSEKLDVIGLKCPRTISLAQKLCSEGFDIDKNISNSVELGGEICRLLSNN